MTEADLQRAGAGPGHTMADWQALHGLDGEVLERLVTRARQLCPAAVPDRPPAGSPPSGNDGQQAWSLALDALVRQVPDLAAFAESVDLNAERALGAAGEHGSRPFTLKAGQNGYPYVYCPHGGSVRDDFSVAHEVGHAVQIVACGQRFMAPVLRETCAFLSERALVAHVVRSERTDADAYLRQFRSDDVKFLAPRLESLRATVPAISEPYSYDWNYPIARLLALECWATSEPALWSKLFLGRLETGHLIRDLDL